jgi:hypothetical protein
MRLDVEYVGECEAELLEVELLQEINDCFPVPTRFPFRSSTRQHLLL